MKESKQVALQKIGSCRRKFNLNLDSNYINYKQPENFPLNCDKKYNFKWVSPITESAQNVNSKIVFVLQDWASAEMDVLKIHSPFVAKKGYDCKAKSNLVLEANIKMYFGIEYKDVFITNLFPFIKSGNASSYIPQELLDKFFEPFCLSQIEIIKPKVVICLGKRVYHTFRKNLTTLTRKGSNEYFKHNNILYYNQLHPSARLSQSKVESCWKNMIKKINYHL